MFKSGIFVMLITLISRVLGLARSVVVAYYFGASAGTDAFFSAFKISNFFRQLLGEGALGTSFIPMYNEKVEKDGEEEGKKFIFSILNIVFIFSVIVSLIMIIFSDEIIGIIVNGFPAETKAIASDLLKIMSCYFIFISLSGMICAILNNFKYFVIPASTSIFFNLAILGGAIFFGKDYGIKAMAYGVLFGGFLQFIIVLPNFFQKVGMYKFKINFKDKYLHRIFYLMIPMLVGIVARQFNTIVDQFFASYLETGGVSALENATRIYNLPIGVFGISISTVIYPTLSRKIVNKNFTAVEDDIKKGLNILLFLVIPSTIVLTVYSTDIVKLIFEYGQFSKRAVEITSDSLFYYSIGLYFYTAIHLMTRAFYGMKNSRDPVKFSVLSIGINVILNALFINILQYKGLALSTSIAAMVNFSLLLYTFRKKYIKINLNSVILFLVKVLVSSAIAVGASFYIKNIIIKLVVFSAVYMALWGYTLYKRKLEAF